MYNDGYITSLTWAYTAGNQYSKLNGIFWPRGNLAEPSSIGFNQVLGSLNLGGYDQSRFVPNDVTFPFAPNDLRDLTVQIEAIIAHSGKVATPLLPFRISAFLGSSLPYLWLPTEACTLFETTFGLVWDTTTELYLVNDTLHASLLASDPSVTFTLGNSTAKSSVDITLPYATFDLIASSLSHSANG